MCFCFINPILTCSLLRRQRIKFKYLEIGLNHNILSGGNNDLRWNQKNAIAVILSRKNIKYWDGK